MLLISATGRTPGPPPACRGSRTYPDEVDHPAVEVRDLEKRYGAVTAVAGLSLTADAGQVLAILGPNGAGKTTTVEMCEGYRRPDAGTVRVLGLDPVADARRLRPRVGVMLQGGGGYPGAKAGEMLRLLAAYAADPLDPGALMERLGLTGAARTRRTSGCPAGRSSGCRWRWPWWPGRSWCSWTSRPPGWTRRPGTRPGTWSGSCASDGVTVVLTTHHMEEAERLADQVVVVDSGRVVAVGSPAELTRRRRRGAAAVHRDARARPGRAGRRAAAGGDGVRAAPRRIPGRRCRGRSTRSWSPR